MKVIFRGLEFGHQVKIFEGFSEEIRASFLIGRLFFLLGFGLFSGSALVRTLSFGVGVELHFDEEVKRKELHAKHSKIPVTFFNPANLILSHIAFGFDTIPDFAVANCLQPILV